MKTAIIILAAGNSSRLGQPKQLITYNGKSLLEKTIIAALDSKADIVILVTGAFKTEIEEITKFYTIATIHNSNWIKGMSSTIQTGLNLLDHTYSSCILSVCDQPFINNDIFNSLIDKKTKLVASKYNEGYGVPALFDRQYFKELKELSGKDGAKSIINLHLNEVEFIDFPQGNIDIDTPEDYNKLNA